MSKPKGKMQVDDFSLFGAETHYHAPKDNASDELIKILTGYRAGFAMAVELNQPNDAGEIQKQAITRLLEWSDKRCLGLIGEDEPTEVKATPPYTHQNSTNQIANARNKLRADLRNKLKGASYEG